MSSTEPGDPAARREANRRSWNAVVPVHNSHRQDQAGFLRAGGLTTFPEELELLGDLSGTRLLHLLCNAGQDSLSFTRLGAIVTGVDLSDAAIALARDLARASGLPARFEQADVYTYLANAAARGERYERIYCGYGAICWLHDIASFARGVAGLLSPGGRFVLVEFHPAANMFDAAWHLAYDYPRDGALLPLDGVGDYVGAAGSGLSPSGYTPGVTDFVNPQPCYLYRWGIGEVVSALAAAGLHLLTLREYNYVNGEQPFERMQSGADRRQYPPADIPAIPLMYGLAMER